MQIVLKDIKYNKLNNINLNIKDNKIVGVIGNIGSGKTDLIMLIAKQSHQETGEICYLNGKNKRIGIISNFSYNEMLEGNVNSFIRKKTIDYNYKVESIDSRVEEIIKMIGLSSNILKEDVFNISKSEKIKVLLSQMLLYNPGIRF